MDHEEARTYINQVTDQLSKAGITVTYVHMDTPEEAAEIGREHAHIDLSVARPVDALVWSDRNGWLTTTRSDLFPLLGGEVQPTPKAVVKEVVSHIHTLAHGGYLRALSYS